MLTPRLKPYYNFKETLAILNPFNKRNAIQRFEEAFADKFDAKYGTMFAHGRTGMYALFKAWNLNDDEIICPAYTCVVVQHAIALSGNIPVFVDAAKDSWNMDYELLEKAITSKTRCIVVTHLFGYPMDVNRVNEIVKKAEEKHGHKIYQLQDCAHSYGAKWENQLVCSTGDAAIFGLNVSKVLNSIFGGMITTNSLATEIALKNWRKQHLKGNKLVKSILRMAYYFAIRAAFLPITFAFTNWLERSGVLDRFVKYYDDNKIYFPGDWDTHPTNTEAAVGLVNLDKYDKVIEKRINNTHFYQDHFKNDNAVKFLPEIDGTTFSHCVAIVEDREAWVEKYFKKGIQLGILIEYSVPEMKAYQSFKRAEYPVAAYYAEHCINFPNYPGLRSSDRKKI